jgi:hypothetical protein
VSSTYCSQKIFCNTTLDPDHPCEPVIPLCYPDDATPPPSHDELERRARARRNSGDCERYQDVIPPQRRDPFNDCEESYGTL